MKRITVFLLLVLIFSTMISSVAAGSSYVHLEPDEYSDNSAVLTGNSGRYYNVYNYSTSEHEVIARLWRNDGYSVIKVKEAYYAPSGGGTTPWYYYSGNTWQLELNVPWLYKGCTAYGTLQTG